jgi:SAM-dependent methyltransferase
VGSLDNCNFSSNTVWEGHIRQGQFFRFSAHRKPGLQFISEATDLANVHSGRYDFVLSSHTLEHVANPLAALREWRRILRSDGVVVLVVPHRDGTFDHRRPITDLEHMIEDECRGVGEDDLTHLEEIIRLHDLRRDPGAGTREAFEARALENVVNRCLHHHVFSTERLLELVAVAGLEPVLAGTSLPYHIAVVARKPSADSQSSTWRSTVLRRALARSPFPTDHEPHSGRGTSDPTTQA